MTVNVKNCQRCGKDHENMKFEPLLNAIDEWNFFGICSETNQPVLLAFIPDSDCDPEVKITEND